MELHPNEIEILRVLEGKLHAKEIARKTNLEIGAVMRALSWLSTKNLVEIEEKIEEEISLGDEGKVYAETGLPERRILNMIGDRGSISEIKKKFGDEELNIGIGWLIKKKIARIRNGNIYVINPEKTEDERILEILRERGKISIDKIPRELIPGLKLLKGRGDVLKIIRKREIIASLTEKGSRIKEEICKKKITERISQLTPELILSRKWKNRGFREYDVKIFVKPEFPARKHPLQQFIDRIREIFIGMGFREIKGTLIESAFWNFDALFVPQDHPARDMHDTFYLKEPREIEIEGFERLKNLIKEVHENGWTTGSIGWDYKWDEREARRVLLRTHTTAVTCRYLSKLKRSDLPAKVFCIGKTFRNEAVDYKHLPEFYQVEGIVVDENANFRNLLGILNLFYREMGFRVRFRPAYFPYTEMSVEPEVYLKERGEWVELGGAGIFRPEVVKPLLGFECPVLAWGLGLDRLVALKLGINDIRTLYLCDLNWLRNSKVV
ncbi:MAG: phenylalanine--tRNA ligase subunit alpha [Candidatus Altiarchaeales archaeon]|nr:MAG: phenylalanine--tRNA ligase subunit alpha [Candidatus Altiarchaeales archaeon]